ncbi:MAG TPA: DNA polymerase III subunit gamma/tau [Gammaproteobacteria bacterium]|nr:DNA polymerase III subunit gamma/tau [Gammaproteobacteria bacterium]
MSYMALARKWRPHAFSEMVGQEHVLRALINALDQGRLHHAFLFSGTRGVGKTTLGRILARCLNCEQGISSEPCGSCSACREIDEGRFVDLIEVDAASRTRVDDTREMLDNIQYAPTRGRFKVYLIDEVHMLSNHSFNALLKSLEEPPPHVKFVLATTDPQKVPVTILSRCLQFSLKRLSRGLIQGQLERITGSEGISAEPAGLAQIAAAADGSMRDALSLLDQAISFGGGALTGADVASMLGAIDRGHLGALLRALADGDGEALMKAAARLEEQTPDYTAVLDGLASTLQRIALAQIVPAAAGDADLDAELVAELGDRLAAEDVQLYYEIALLGKRNLPLAPDPRGGFEMTLLRMLAFRPAGTEEGPSASADAPPAPSGGPPRPGPAEAVPRAARAAPKAGNGAAQPAPAPSVPGPGGGAPPDWPAVVSGLALSGIARELAHNCTVAAREGNVVRLALDPSHSQMHTPAAAERLQKSVQRFLGEPELRVRIEIGATSGHTPAQREADRRARRQQEAVEAVETDPNVKALRDRFGAELFTDSIKPVD